MAHTPRYFVSQSGKTRMLLTMPEATQDMIGLRAVLLVVRPTGPDFFWCDPATETIRYDLTEAGVLTVHYIEADNATDDTRVVTYSPSGWVSIESPTTVTVEMSGTDEQS